VDQLLCAALLEAKFEPLLDFAVVLGLPSVEAAWMMLKNQDDPRVRRVAPLVRRCLEHLYEGHRRAAACDRGTLAGT